MTIKTPLEMLYKQVDERPEQLFLTQPKNGNIIEYCWRDFDTQVRKVAQGLVNLDLPKGSHIGLISKNCAEWFITDLAIMMAGHVSIPIFPTAGSDTISYVLNHAKCPVVFVGKLEHPEEQIQAIPDAVKSIGFDYPGANCNLTWSEFTNTEPFVGNPVPSMDDPMTIIYTSGSTGSPKAYYITTRQ